MTSSRSKAIRITIVTAAISLLLSAICAAAFIMSMTGAFAQGPQSAAADMPEKVSMVWCVSEQDRPAPAAKV